LSSFVVLEAVEVVDQEVDGFDFSKIFFHLFFSLTFLISGFIFSSSLFSFDLGNFSVLDFVLPFDEINVLFLFPVFILFLVEIFPDLFVFLFYFLDFGFLLVKTLLFSFLPILVLFVVPFLFFGFFVFLCSQDSLKSSDLLVFLIEFSLKVIVFFINRILFFLDFSDLVIKLFFQIFSLFQFHLKVT